MAFAIPLIMLAGGAVAAYGSIKQAEAQQSAANYNAAMADQNARIALEQAGAQASLQRQRATQIQGSVMAGYSAAGVTSDGSPSDVLAMSVSNAALDEQNILYMGRLRSIGYVNEATLDRFSGRTAQEQGQLNAASSLLTSVGRATYGYSGMARGTPIRSRNESPHYEEY